MEVSAPLESCPTQALAGRVFPQGSGAGTKARACRGFWEGGENLHVAEDGGKVVLQGGKVCWVKPHVGKCNHVADGSGREGHGVYLS
jgi:hypothetical protein